MLFRSDHGKMYIWPGQQSCCAAEAERDNGASFVCLSLNKTTSALCLKGIDEAACEVCALNSMGKLIFGPLQTPAKMSESCRVNGV